LPVRSHLKKLISYTKKNPVRVFLRGVPLLEARRKETGNMPVFTPQNIDFGVVAPGSTNSNNVMSDPFTAEDHVTAAITNDTSGGGFKVQAVKVQGSQSDGITPLTVSKGQSVAVLVQFVVPVRSTNQVYAATLEIHGDTWTTSIPLTALCALT
jgi:hypothetical protein